MNSYSQIYAMNNHIPLHEMGHGGYLASKPPIRKNKDYKARPRNYVIGFPVFKKDHYTRHFYNLRDVLHEENAPAIKYSKALLKGVFFGSVMGLLWKLNPNYAHELLSNHTHQMQRTNYSHFKIKNIINAKGLGKYAAAFGFLFLSHKLLTDLFE